MKYQSRKFAAIITLALPVSLTNIAFAQGFDNQMAAPKEGQQYEFICKFAKPATTPSSSNFSSAENVSKPRNIRVQGKDLIITPIFDSTAAPLASSVTNGNEKSKADLSGLKQFYKMLWTSEAKHGNIFVRMALKYWDEKEVYERLNYLMQKEGEICAALPLRPALH